MAWRDAAALTCTGVVKVEVETCGSVFEGMPVGELLVTDTAEDTGEFPVADTADDAVKLTTLVLESDPPAETDSTELETETVTEGAEIGDRTNVAALLLETTTTDVFPSIVVFKNDIVSTTVLVMQPTQEVVSAADPADGSGKMTNT